MIWIPLTSYLLNASLSFSLCYWACAYHFTNMQYWIACKYLNLIWILVVAIMNLKCKGLRTALYVLKVVHQVCLHAVWLNVSVFSYWFLVLLTFISIMLLQCVKPSSYTLLYLKEILTKFLKELLIMEVLQFKILGKSFQREVIFS